MNMIVVFLMGLGLVACSHGLQETAFKDENGTYIVSRSLVNDRITSNQPHVQGIFACDSKLSDRQLKEKKVDGNEYSQYTMCQPIEMYKPGAYHLTSDQPIGTLYKGPIEAAIIGSSIGTGLAFSGDTVTQRGGGGVAVSGSSSSASAVAKGGHGHRR